MEINYIMANEDKTKYVMATHGKKSTIFFSYPFIKLFLTGTILE